MNFEDHLDEPWELRPDPMELTTALWTRHVQDQIMNQSMFITMMQSQCVHEPKWTWKWWETERCKKCGKELEF